MLESSWPVSGDFFHLQRNQSQRALYLTTLVSWLTAFPLCLQWNVICSITMRLRHSSFIGFSNVSIPYRLTSLGFSKVSLLYPQLNPSNWVTDCNFFWATKLCSTTDRLEAPASNSFFNISIETIQSKELPSSFYLNSPFCSEE
jgi:hypothetical protein